MTVPARFLRTVGIVACVIGLSVLLFMAASRFYTLSNASSVQAAQEYKPYSHSDQVIPPSGEDSGMEPRRQPVTRQEVPELDVPFFSVPPPHPSPANEIYSSGSTLHMRRTSPASPSETGNSVIRLVIPDLRLDAPVRYIPFVGNTWDINDLEQSVAWLGNMNEDDTVRNLVLAGHVTVFDGSHGPFRYLSRLTPGAKLVVYTDQYIYTYQVRELSIVKPEDAYLTGDTPQSQLTLITCATWNEKTKSYLRRQVVIADLLKVEPYLQGMVK